MHEIRVKLDSFLIKETLGVYSVSNPIKEEKKSCVEKKKGLQINNAQEEHVYMTN